MKLRIIYFLGILALLASCTRNNSSKENGVADNKDATTETIMEEHAVDIQLSYDSLNYYIKNNKEIPCPYFESNGKAIVDCPLSQAVLVKELDRFIVIKTMYLNQSLDAYPYYLCTFSKETAKIVSFIPLGKEAEAVTPYEIKWKSDREFKTMEYSYEFIEDEESGAYLRGEIKDSTIINYQINTNGEIVSLTN